MPAAESGHDIMTRLLKTEETRLRIDLQDIRDRYEHAGDKGSQGERALRDFLRRYLPSDTQVGHGEVFGVDGARSRQTDVVVANKYHLALESNWEEAQTFIVEGVDCGAEVKLCINDADDVQDYFEKAKSFKSVISAQQKGALLWMGEDDDFRRFIARKPFFGFAFESRVSLERIAKELSQMEETLREIERPVLDAIFVMDKGAFIHFGTGKGRFTWVTPDGTRKGGYRRFPHDGVMSHLLLWIFATTPRIEYPVHPAFSYLQADDQRLKLTLTDEGKVSRSSG